MRDNILPASAPVMLDGEAYVLRYRAYAYIVYAEQVRGDLLADLTDVGKDLQRFGEAAIAAAAEGAVAPPVALGPLFGRVRDLLWAGLVDAQPTLTRDQVARLFSFADLPAIVPVVTQAIQMGLPKKAAEAAPPANPPEPRHDSEASNGRGYGLPSAILAE